MNGRSRAFTIVELMVVVAIIVLVLGLLFPAFGAFRRSGLMTKSMANMRQISSWMKLYASDNRDAIVPSRFNYQQDSHPGNVRSVFTSAYVPWDGTGGQYRGTWADILWTVFEVGVFPEGWGSSGGGADPGSTPGGSSPCLSSPCKPCNDFRYDSPDHELYCMLGPGIENPFRSAAPNSRGTRHGGGELATPYQCGANEKGDPGYFAANDYFNNDRDAMDCLTGQVINLNPHLFTNSVIRAPDRSMYLVDSVAGEIIRPTEPPYQYLPDGGNSTDDPVPLGPVEVDFRYSGSCLMLFLDSHIGTEVPWENLQDLEGEGRKGDVNNNGRIDPGRGVRITDLTSR